MIHYPTSGAENQAAFVMRGLLSFVRPPFRLKTDGGSTGEPLSLFLSALIAHAVAIADQLVVSCASFLATVLVGRSSTAAELGAYAMAISLVATLVTVQDSLIAVPYSIGIFDKDGEGRGSAVRDTFTLSLALSAASFLGFFSWDACRCWRTIEAPGF
ncbi:hypothetical protein ACRAWG_11385 [Methylobacterium sp. P31]